MPKRIGMPYSRRREFVLLTVAVSSVIGLQLQNASAAEVAGGMAVALLVAIVLIVAVGWRRTYKSSASSTSSLDASDRRLVRRAVSRGERIAEERLAAITVTVAIDVRSSGMLFILGLGLCLAVTLVSIVRGAGDDLKTVSVVVALGGCLLLLQAFRVIQATRSARRNR
jgi:flagellar biogenesis protein FliO